METLAQGMSMLLQREEGRDQADQVRSMEDDVGGKLDTFSVFANNPGARASAMTSVKNAMVLNPQANMDKVVSEAAQAFQGAIEQAAGAAHEVQTGGGAHVVPIPFPGIDGARVSAQMASGESIHTADQFVSNLLDGPR